MCDGGVITLPNDERVKVEVIENVIIETHWGFKNSLGDVKYEPKSEPHFIK